MEPKDEKKHKVDPIDALYTIGALGLGYGTWKLIGHMLLRKPKLKEIFWDPFFDYPGAVAIGAVGIGTNIKKQLDDVLPRNIIPASAAAGASIGGFLLRKPMAAMIYRTAQRAAVPVAVGERGQLIYSRTAAAAQAVTKHIGPISIASSIAAGALAGAALAALIEKRKSKSYLTRSPMRSTAFAPSCSM